MTAYGDGARRALPGHDLNAEGYAGLLGLSRGADGSAAHAGACRSPTWPPGCRRRSPSVSGLRVAEPRRAGGVPRRRHDARLRALAHRASAQGSVVATGEAPADAGHAHRRARLLRRLPVRRRPRARVRRARAAVLRPRRRAGRATRSSRPRQYDVAGQDALRGRLTTLFAVAAARASGSRCSRTTRPASRPVRTSADALADPDLRRPRRRRRTSRSPTARLVAAGPTGGLGPRAGDPTRTSAPALGADTDAVLAELGSDPATAARHRGPGSTAPRRARLDAPAATRGATRATAERRTVGPRP